MDSYVAAAAVTRLISRRTVCAEARISRPNRRKLESCSSGERWKMSWHNGLPVWAFCPCFNLCTRRPKTGQSCGDSEQCFTASFHSHVAALSREDLSQRSRAMRASATRPCAAKIWTPISDRARCFVLLTITRQSACSHRWNDPLHVKTGRVLAGLSFPSAGLPQGYSHAKPHLCHTTTLGHFHLPCEGLSRLPGLALWPNTRTTFSTQNPRQAAAVRT